VTQTTMGWGRTRTICGTISGVYDAIDRPLALAHFLASDESRRSNGAVITADAGWTGAWPAADSDGA